MSHYPLLALLKEGQELERLLAPYSMEIEVKPYIITTKDEFIARTKKVFRRDYPEISELPDDQFIETMKKWDYTFDESGNELSTVNPKGFWGYWTVGGHYTNMLKLKSTGECVNSAKVKDIDFGINQEAYKSNIRFWELVVEGSKPKDSAETEIVKYANAPGFYVSISGTKGNWAKTMSTFSTFAVLTPDGVWHDDSELVNVHTWIMTYKERFIDTADPDWIAVIVDCHI